MIDAAPLSGPVPAARRSGVGWQLILADLALILFLVTLSALPAAEAESGQRLADRDARPKDALGVLAPEVAPAQALYRPVAGGPSLGAWLAAQPRDPRATLTVFVHYLPGEAQQAWQQAEALTDEARAEGVAVRTILTASESREVYASLAYDTVIAGGSK